MRGVRTPEQGLGREAGFYSSSYKSPPETRTPRPHARRMSLLEPKRNLLRPGACAAGRNL